MMSEITNMLVRAQVAIFAESPSAAAILIVVFDCLLVYVCALPARKRVGQTEFAVLVAAIVVVVLVTLEFMRDA